MTTRDSGDPDGFYRAFEERFRGPQSLVRERLEQYRPFVEPFLGRDSRAARLTDLGCGRGEWMCMLRDFGFEVEGVDLDEGMLSACREAGLSVCNVDALEHLRSLPAQSRTIISGFHIAEHLPFSVLRALVEEALRVLAPGGLLILETPNPENFSVSTLTFHLDPTHRKPLPPGLLQFLAEYSGFGASHIIRLNHDSSLPAKRTLSLSDVLQGASPDYALVAQKAGAEELEAAVSAAADGAQGISAHLLLGQFNQQAVGTETRFERITQELAVALGQVAEHQHQIGQFEKHVTGTEARFERITQELAIALGQVSENQRRIQEVSTAYEHRLFEYWQEGVAAREQLAAIYSSRSWRITRPVRLLSSRVRQLKGINRILELPSEIIIRTLERNPGMRRWGVATLRKAPLLNRLVRRIIVPVLAQQVTGWKEAVDQNFPMFGFQPEHSERTAQVLAMFKVALEQRGAHTDETRT
ncbi:class I SAM-dependent methyltransferase [Mesorhizobium sp.]|uniref:class I SAM-dependent methyltransferase n=1 Tax=Mesorhizobium sp. TaxID=1871066 RepID=UPI0025BC018D|nr:class I SAM-dependent methyltransferase [Mesorhizobium sp.]